MKYFLDTEFHEYKKKPLFGKPIDTIELISIGIVNDNICDERLSSCSRVGKDLGIEKYCSDCSSQNSAQYYAICKDFDLKAAWNSFQWEDEERCYDGCKIKEKVKVYWLRENVLRPIFDELALIDRDHDQHSWFNFKNLKYLINKYGKSRDQIAREVKEFVYYKSENHKTDCCLNVDSVIKPEFYAYYADYDWVVFCWLFGRMIDLPKGLPMYCRDLKQMLDDKAIGGLIPYSNEDGDFIWTLSNIKNFPGYPKQDSEHNALSDAKWNKELYKFLKTLQLWNCGFVSR